MFFNVLNVYKKNTSQFFYSQKVLKKSLFLIRNLMYLFLNTLLDENKPMI